MDVAQNRRLFIQLPGYSIALDRPVTFNFGGACVWSEFQDPRVRPADACAVYAVRWRVEYREDTMDPQFGFVPRGTIEESHGLDFVTATLEDDGWALCHSDFSGTRVISPPGASHASVPFRVER